MKNHLNGPYIHALGWTHGVEYIVSSKSSPEWATLERTLDFPASGSARLIRAVDSDALIGPLSGPFLKDSGVARARSAAKSTVLAAVMARDLARHLANQPGDGNRVSLGVVSSSAIAPVFWTFESVGVGDSWNNTDTMLLPASIPSCVVTTASNVTDFHASAITYGDGAAGVFAAIEHAHLDFLHERADHALVLCAEEVCAQMVEGMKVLGVDREPLDGAAGLVLTRERISQSDWQVTMVEVLDQSQPHPVPGHAGLHIVVSHDDDCGTYTGTSVPEAIHFAIEQAIAVDQPEVLLEYRLGRRARCVLRLQH